MPGRLKMMSSLFAFTTELLKGISFVHKVVQTKQHRLSIILYRLIHTTSIHIVRLSGYPKCQNRT